MTREQCCDLLADDETVIFLEPSEFDAAIVGVVREFGRPARIAYSAPHVIALFCAGGMSYEEAVEYFEFNVAGAYMGETTPAFVYHMSAP
jgi:hypothetical protein